ncbi:MAG: metallophosphoesterase, partial [Planctomycetota bacterium]
YAYTMIGPKTGWDWTLGKEQYEWLYETLHASGAKWKFIFMHQIVSTVAPNMYGRGGIEVAKYQVDNRPSFEWGGEDETGAYVFTEKRPGWNYGAIHDMLVQEDVTMVFHGHDHFFAFQELDGVVYLECPQPGDSEYGWGCKDEGKYTNGTLIQNSGHVQVTVAFDFVKVEYVRAYLPGDGMNGEIAFSHAIDR